jgi:hypothetical protein
VTSGITLKHGPPVKLMGALAAKLDNWYPGLHLIDDGWRAADLINQSITMEMNGDDIATGVPWSCTDCALGKMAKRYGLNPAIAAKSTVAYFLNLTEKIVVRATVPMATKLIVDRQDHKGQLQPGSVHFTAITESNKLGAPRPNRTHNRHPNRKNPSFPTGLRSLQRHSNHVQQENSS